MDLDRSTATIRRPGNRANALEPEQIFWLEKTLLSVQLAGGDGNEEHKK
jgi:hypothetical protein